MDATGRGSQVDKIKFPEFTASLISGVFDAITANQIKQMEAYTEMLSKTSKTLTEFVNETKDDITGGELLEFLSNTFSYVDSLDSNKVKSIQYGEVYELLQKEDDGEAPVPQDVKTKLKEDLEVKDDEGNVISPEPSSAKAMLEAAKFRISENKYQLLRDMMKLGYQKLTVEKGFVKTKLEFFAKDHQHSILNTSDFKRQNRNWGVGGRFRGGFLGGILGIRGGISSSSLQVSTVNTQKVAISDTTVDIFGSVEVNFKSDYFPLANFDN